MVSRGQAYTLEGVLAAILVVTATVYGLQSIDTRAWEDETDSDVQQLQYRASDVLTLAGESGALRDAVVCYRKGRPIDGNRDRSLSEFERMLNTTFDSQADQYQLTFSYWDGDTRRSTVVSQKTDNADKRPPAAAAVASTTVTVTDDTRRRDDSCDPIPPTVKETEKSFYMDDVASSSLFNIVEVRLAVW